MHFFCIFFQKNLHISKICCTFASNLKTNHENIFYILTIRFNSQITFIYKQQKVCHYEKSLFSKNKIRFASIQFK